jgi:hypothetical protein
MLRIRFPDGRVQEIPQGVFIELVNPHDKAVGSVWFQRDPHCVLRIAPGSQDAVRYSEMFGVRFHPTEVVRSDLLNR